MSYNQVNGYNSVTQAPTSITINNIQTSTTDTLSYTPTDVVDSCLVVFVSSEDTLPVDTITGVEFGGVPLVLVGVAQGFISTTAMDTAVAYLINPGVLSGNITVNGGQHSDMCLTVTTLGGVEQLNPVDVFDIADNAVGVSGTVTSETTTSSGSLVLSGMGYGDILTSSVVGATKLTQVVASGPSGSSLSFALSLSPSPSTYTHVWTVTSLNRMSAISVAFNFSGNVNVVTTLGAIDYASQNTTVELLGAVDVTATLGAISYASQSTSVQLSGEVNVSATLGLISYDSKSTAIQLSGAIELNATLGTIDYSSLNVLVELTGETNVNATLGSIDYASNNTVIGITSGIILSATLGQIDYNSQSTSITLQGQINIPVTLGQISYDSNNVIIDADQQQVIGVVTAMFKPDVITVNFKT